MSSIKHPQVSLSLFKIPNKRCSSGLTRKEHLPVKPPRPTARDTCGWKMCLKRRRTLFSGTASGSSEAPVIDFKGAPIRCSGNKNQHLSIIFMDSLGKLLKASWIFLKWDDSWNFPGALRGGRGDCRSLIGTQTDWIYEDLLWNSPKNFTPKTTLHSEFETSLDLEKKLSNLSVLCDNSNVPWLGHETLHQILPPCGGAPICPLRKGNTSPEIRLPH